MTTNSASGLTATLTAEGDAIAGFRTFTYSFSQALIDATSADSSRWGEYLVGRRDATIDVDALYVYSDIGQKVLDEHAHDAAPSTITCVLTMPDSRTYTGECIVESLSYNVPAEDVITASCTLRFTDGVTTTTS